MPERKPVAEISDRAKRYRAHKAIRGRKVCRICGSRRFLVPDHKDGDESNNRPSNLRWLCKSCNTREGKRMAKAGKGVRTRQYNPAGAINLAQYVQAAMDHVRGSHDAAGKIIHETPKAQRRAFAREIWFRRGYRGKNPVMRTLARKIDALLPQPVPANESDFFADLEDRLFGVQPSMYKHHHVRKPSWIARKNPESAADAGFRKFHGYGPNEHYLLNVPEVDPYGKHPELFQCGLLLRLIVGEGIKMSGKDGDKIEALDDDFWHYEIPFVPSYPRYVRMMHDNPPQTQLEENELKAWLRSVGCPDVAGVPDFGKTRSAPLASRQLYIIGGKQELSRETLIKLGCDPEKELCDLGFCYLIEYRTQKGFDKRKPIDYWHHFGELTDVRPRVIYNRTHKLLFLVGGEYVVKSVGIDN